MSPLLVVPYKGGANQKSRLAGRLCLAARAALSEQMARCVLETAVNVVGTQNVIVLSPRPPNKPNLNWRQDEGRGLNAELSAFRKEHIDRVFLVVSADLPFLEPEELAQLVAATVAGRVALAPDRRRRGTNAVGLPEGAQFLFEFGEDSFARHLTQAAPHEAVVARRGLTFDIDTPADLDAAMGEGLMWDEPGA